jgi:hypothetical protein
VPTPRRGDEISAFWSRYAHFRTWYIVQNRPGFLSGFDRRLIARFGPGRVISTKWGVPLVWAFSREDVAAATVSAGG